MSGEHLPNSKRSESEPAKITDLTGEVPTARANVEFTMRSLDLARLRLEVGASSNLRSARASFLVGLVSGLIGAALTVVSVFESHVNKWIVIYLVGAVLVVALGAAVGFFLSSRRDRHEGVALDKLTEVLREQGLDVTSKSDVSGEGNEAAEDRDV